MRKFIWTALFFFLPNGTRTVTPVVTCIYRLLTPRCENQRFLATFPFIEAYVQTRIPLYNVCRYMRKYVPVFVVAEQTPRPIPSTSHPIANRQRNRKKNQDQRPFGRIVACPPSPTKKKRSDDASPCTAVARSGRGETLLTQT